MDEEFTNFLCNIHTDVTYEMLFQLLIQFTELKSLFYKSKVAHVVYHSMEDQDFSIEKLDGVLLYGREMKVEKVQRKVKLEVEISAAVDRSILEMIFSRFGSCKIVYKRLRCYEIIYRRRDYAEKAKEVLNAVIIKVSNDLNVEFEIKYSD